MKNKKHKSPPHKSNSKLTKNQKILLGTLLPIALLGVCGGGVAVGYYILSKRVKVSPKISASVEGDLRRGAKINVDLINNAEWSDVNISESTWTKSSDGANGHYFERQDLQAEETDHVIIYLIKGNEVKLDVTSGFTPPSPVAQKCFKAYQVGDFKVGVTPNSAESYIQILGINGFDVANKNFTITWSGGSGAIPSPTTPTTSANGRIFLNKPNYSGTFKNVYITIGNDNQPDTCNFTYMDLTILPADPVSFSVFVNGQLYPGVDPSNLVDGKPTAWFELQYTNATDSNPHNFQVSFDPHNGMDTYTVASNYSTTYASGKCVVPLRGYPLSSGNMVCTLEDLTLNIKQTVTLTVLPQTQSFTGYQVGNFKVGVDPGTQSYIQLVGNHGYVVANKRFTISDNQCQPVSYDNTTDANGRIFIDTPTVSGTFENVYIEFPDDSNCNNFTYIKLTILPAVEDFNVFLDGNVYINTDPSVFVNGSPTAWFEIQYDSTTFNQGHNFSLNFGNTPLGFNNYQTFSQYSPAYANGKIVVVLSGTPDQAGDVSCTLTDMDLGVSKTITFTVSLPIVPKLKIGDGAGNNTNDTLSTTTQSVTGNVVMLDANFMAQVYSAWITIDNSYNDVINDNYIQTSEDGITYTNTTSNNFDLYIWKQNLTTHGNIYIKLIKMYPTNSMVHFTLWYQATDSSSPMQTTCSVPILFLNNTSSDDSVQNISFHNMLTYDGSSTLTLMNETTFLNEIDTKLGSKFVDINWNWQSGTDINWSTWVDGINKANPWQIAALLACENYYWLKQATYLNQIGTDFSYTLRIQLVKKTQQTNDFSLSFSQQWRNLANNAWLPDNDFIKPLKNATYEAWETKFGSYSTVGPSGVHMRFDNCYANTNGVIQQGTAHSFGFGLIPKNVAAKILYNDDSKGDDFPNGMFA